MNERIDHTNYEAWLLDRLEGNLTPQQEAALEAFLAQHPELAPIDEDLPLITVEPIGISFDKDLLKRSIPPQDNVTDTSIEDHLIAKLEGDLSPEQLLALEKFLYEHPEHANSDRIYALTKLVPQAMAFAAKQELERQLPPIGKVDKYTLDDHLVAQLEGDLSAEQEFALEAYLKQYPEAQKVKRIMARTKIAADRVSYSRKESLKKGGKVISISFQRNAIRYGAAASVAILLGLAIWSVVNGPIDQAPVLVNNTITVDRTTGQEQLNKGMKGQQSDPVTVASVPVAEDRTVQDRMAADIAEPTERSTAMNNTIPVEKVDRDVQEQDLRVEPELADRITVMPENSLPEREPIQVPVLEAPITFDEGDLAETVPVEEATNSIGTLVASAVRGIVLEKPSPEQRPLDRGDAVAAVDKGLKAIGGDKAGLEVKRSKSGKIRTFNLRVGDLALTASTGR